MGVAAKPPIVAERDQTPYLLWREPPELPVLAQSVGSATQGSSEA